MLGGGYLRERRHRPEENWKPAYELEITSGLLRMVLPTLTLRIKAKQQALLLEAVNLLKTQNHWTLQNDERLEEIRLELKKLNKKGRLALD